MSQPIDPAPTPAPSPAADHHKEPGDEEVVYFEGRPQMRADQAKLVLWILIGAALVALAIAGLVIKTWTFWRWWMSAAACLFALLIILVPWLKLRATRYRISNYRIDYERGILKKQIDTLELWHVEDIHFEQGIIDRICNVGSITVISNDKTSPRLELHGVPRPREIFDALKQRIIAVKRQRGVLKLDAG